MKTENKKFKNQVEKISPVEILNLLKEKLQMEDSKKEAKN